MNALTGIVSRDWKGLQIISLDRFEVLRIPHMFIFNLNVVFTIKFLKMALIPVRFCPGFPPELEFTVKSNRSEI
jgi:hypothetical protein